MIRRIARCIHTSDRFLGLAVLATLLVRLFLLSNYYCISIDGVSYVGAAKDLYAGNLRAALSSVYPPGYPALIAVFYSFLRDWEWAGQMISLVAGVGLLFPLYGLLRSIYGTPVARIGCFLAAINPYLALYSVHVRAESIFIFLSVLALYVFHRGVERRRVSDFIAGGLIASVAYLVKPEAIGFVIMIPSVLVILWWTRREWEFAYVARASAGLLMGFLLFATPYIVYLSSATGQWGTLSRKAGVTLAVSLRESGLLDDDILTEFPTRESMSLPEFVADHPWVYTKKFFIELAFLVPTYLEALYYSYAPFVLIGLFGFFCARPWERKDFLLLVYLIFFSLAFTAIYLNRRYLVQVVPISMGWTAIGMVCCWNWAKRNWSETTTRVAMFTATAVFLAVTLPKTLKPVSQEKKYLKEAGQYIRQLYGPGHLSIMVSDSRIAFYAGADRVSMPKLSKSDVMAQLRERKIEFLAAETIWLKKRYPMILDSVGTYGFQLVKEFAGRDRNRLVVYRRS